MGTRRSKSIQTLWLGRAGSAGIWFPPVVYCARAVDNTIGQRFTALVCIAADVDTIRSVGAIRLSPAMIAMATKAIGALDEGVCDTPLYLCVRRAAQHHRRICRRSA